MPRVALSSKAQRDLKKLSPLEQKAVYDSLVLLQKDPRHNSLKTSKHKKTGYLKSRASDSLRMLWFYEGDTIIVVRIGGHEINELKF